MLKVKIYKYLPKYYIAQATLKAYPYPINFNGYGATSLKALNDLFVSIKSNNINKI